MMTSEERGNHYKREALRILGHKRKWKRRCAVSSALAGWLALVCLALAIAGKTPDCKQGVYAAEVVGAATLPPESLATLIMFNGDVQCSATVFDRDNEVGWCFGCGHCFEGRIGGQFTVFRPDGKTATATLVALWTLERDGVDLSLFTIPAADVLAVAPLAYEMPARPKRYDVVGYPAGVGPTWHPLKAGRTCGCGKHWWFPLADGTIYGGNSGSGVFVDGQLCGVLSKRSMDRDGGKGGSELQCATQAQLVAFLRANCRDGRCPPQFRQRYQFQPRPNGDLPRPVDPPPADPRAAPPAEPPSTATLAQLLALVEKIAGATKPEQITAIIEQLGTLQTKVDAVSAIPTALQKLELLLQLAREEKEGAAPLDPEALRATLRQETQQILIEQTQTLKQQLSQQFVSQNVALAGVPEEVRQAAAGGVSELKTDVVSAVAAKAGSGWLMSILGGLIGGGPAVGAMFGLRALWRLWRGRKSSPSASPGGNSPSASGAGPFDLQQLAELLAARLQSSASAGAISIHQQPGKPFPVLIDSPPPPQQVITETAFTPLEKNSFADAYAWSKATFARKYPNQAEGFFGLLDSLIRQHLAGQGVQNAGFPQ